MNLEQIGITQTGRGASKLPNSDVRLLIAALGVFTLWPLYFQTATAAHAHSTFWHPPWISWEMILYLLGLATLVVVDVFPILLRGGMNQRMLAAILAGFPVYVLLKYVGYLGRLFGSD